MCIGECMVDVYASVVNGCSSPPHRSSVSNALLQPIELNIDQAPDVLFRKGLRLGSRCLSILQGVIHIRNRPPADHINLQINYTAAFTE